MKVIEFINGSQLPLLGLGTWLSNKNEVYNAVFNAIGIGYRHFDCASIYGNEAEIGRALHDALKDGLVKREDLFITSKLWNSDHSPERVEIALRKSLKDLQLEYLDLYLIHWPVAFKTRHEHAGDASDLVSLDEIPLLVTWQALEKMKAANLTMHIGVSNFNILKLQKLIDEASIRPELNQIELHPYFQQKELVAFCQANKILVTAYSPLGSSHLVKSTAGLTREAVVLKISKKQACTPVQVLLAWGMQRGTSVIPKSVHTDRMLENYGALRVTLDAIDMADIATLERNLRITTGAFCALPGSSYTLKSIWEE